MTVRDKLLDFIRGLELDFSGELTDDTPLLESGLLDSLALLQLAQWVELEVGRKLDPAAFDLQKEWSTVAGILRFVEAQKSSSSENPG